MALNFTAMKHLTTFILALAISLAAFAQPGEKLDSILFIFPQFEQGIVTFDDGSRSAGPINIYLVDQSVRVLSDDGEFLLVNGNESVMKVNAGGRIFYRGREGMIEILAYADDAFLGLIRSTTMIDNAKKGAYGTVSTTASIDNYSYGDNGPYGNLYHSIADLPENYLYKEYPCLYRRGAQIGASKKGFIKCFPEDKVFIENYLKEHPVNFGRLDEVREFFLLLKGRH